ncbi:DNA polymerase nu-like [Tubulanus polymorphus]|uniref:DNA polymerase nu-like n=1 Tax=Tubulanus polymorphus TaxID=672921 RepID=UPI003DA58717
MESVRESKDARRDTELESILDTMLDRYEDANKVESMNLLKSTHQQRAGSGECLRFDQNPKMNKTNHSGLCAEKPTYDKNNLFHKNDPKHDQKPCGRYTLHDMFGGVSKRFKTNLKESALLKPRRPLIDIAKTENKPITANTTESVLRRQLKVRQESIRKMKASQQNAAAILKKGPKRTMDDADLLQIEELLDGRDKQNFSKSKTKTDAETVSKMRQHISVSVERSKLKKHENSDKSESCENVTWNQLACAVISRAEQLNDDIKDYILNCKQIALTLLFENMTTQLSQPDAHKANEYRLPITITGILKYLTPLYYRDFLDKILRSRDLCKICYNGQELIRELLKYEYITPTDAVKYQILDVKVAAWLLDADNAPMSFEEICQKSHVKNRDLSVAAVINTDLIVLHEVMGNLSGKLVNNDLWDIFTKVEMPLCPILAVMELQGIRVDKGVMHYFGDVIKRKLNCLETAAHKAAGRIFVINSHPQLRQVIFEELQLDRMLDKSRKIARTTVNKEKSTSEAVLHQLKEVHPLPAIILEYRQLQKLKSTYIDGLLPYVNRDGVLRTMWEHTSAATGRLTSARPNIQSIPKQPVLVSAIDDTISGCGDGNEYEIFARQPFVSRSGWSFLAADFQQIELRLLAHLSGDQTLLKVFNSVVCSDIFVDLSAKWLKKPQNQVTKSNREQTKRIVYSVMYGVGKERLSDYLKTSPENAKQIMNTFLDTFPGIRAFTKQCINQCKTTGYVCTIFKRRRLIPNIDNDVYFIRAQAERQAVNFCVQGSAADLCKAAMIQVVHVLNDRAFRSRLIVQIHDELLFEVPDEELDAVKGIIHDVMENSRGLCGDRVTLTVPLTVAVNVGKNWAQMD